MREFNVDIESMLGIQGFRDTQYFFSVQDGDEDVGDSSRLTLNCHPDKVKDAIEVMVGLMHQAPWSELIRKTKIQALSRLGKTTDCIVIYCTFSPGQVMALAQAIDKKIPQGFRIEHTPFGMERIYTGVAYSERKDGDSGSHGNSRKRIICRALKRCHHNPDLDLSRVLNEELLLSGYDSGNPARLVKTNEFMELLSKFARGRELTVESADLEQDCRGLFGRNTAPPEMTRESEIALKKMFERFQGHPDLRVQRLGYGMRPLSAPSLGISNEAAVRFLKVSRTDGVRGDESKPWAVLTLCLSPENTVKSLEQLQAELELLKQEKKPAFLLYSSPETVKRSGTAVALYLQSDPDSVQQCMERLTGRLKGSLQENACIPVMEKCSEGVFYSEALNSRDSLETSRGAAVAMAFRKTAHSGYFLENLSEALQALGLNPENPARLL
ncbi:T3SS effector HopA1 family protein [Endozoicomonas arenosclerae]|uniref:T3SS effector HopA1 family protein n=1 Tax=Endozoicomonas arenosclerae TaxID=1633495 RepID=UPI000781F7EF|nr:T3SS effector HopA1 family protein [Endozoicomonas arenosclerae]